MSRVNTSDVPNPRAAANGGPALFRLVRFWSRRWTNQPLTTSTPDGDTRRVQNIQVVEAVAAARDEATVTTVAEQLGLDHSGASRMVRDAVAAGHLHRGESNQDRRRVALRLTDDGRQLLTASHDWQRRCFDQLTATWDDTDRRRFAAYLQRLADETLD
ncbi:MarR family winged helix-turn-helix transcriptional regulator [Stackebrandtia nassauensis]|uniref:Transcriptional regulator, MarR family n=1 Tax=Stackebrandtia nassauensis (strain DSM 44728 / CIP 108903 / NRRL B-16338 / NBRC 102104 / LLR-40K-21) TaxID=446470 RepID=D3PWT4_STANL|nr:transcriptional regulator, MarR family [Stackebrandtia nassauensis DSM 44728]